MYNSDLDAKNPHSFLAYTDPDVYKNLIHKKIRRVGSFRGISTIQQISEIYALLGNHKTYATNYQGKACGWITKTEGWSDRGFPIYPFRYIDFLNVLLGSYRSGTAVALSDKHLSHISNIRIDFDFDNYSGAAAVLLAKEIQEKLAGIGMDCYFLATGSRGIQAIIPFPCVLPLTDAKVIWSRLQTYLDTTVATLDKCSINSYLRLPLGIHAKNNNLSLYFSVDTGGYVSHYDQLTYFRNSWQWQYPTHITDALDEDAFTEQIERGFTFVPISITQGLKGRQTQAKLPRNSDWAVRVWDMRTQLQPGMWQAYLIENNAIHAAYALYGDSALSKLEELAAEIPIRQHSDIQDRIRVVRRLWQDFNPIQIPKQSSKMLALMLTTKISSETYIEADLLFNYIKRKKQHSTRWVNENAHDYILAVLHGINCSDSDSVTITIDELLIYMQQALFSPIVRMTLRRIIQKSTQPALPIRTKNMNQLQVQNELAVCGYDPGQKIFTGATPGRFEKIRGLKKKALRVTNSTI